MTDNEYDLFKDEGNDKADDQQSLPFDFKAELEASTEDPERDFEESGDDVEESAMDTDDCNDSSEVETFTGIPVDQPEPEELVIENEEVEKDKAPLKLEKKAPLRLEKKVSEQVEGKPSSKITKTGTIILNKNELEKEKAEEAAKKDSEVVRKLTVKGGTRGQILQEGRVSSGLSLDQVAMSTKIKKSYIEALELDDVSNLPPAVFIKAYSKALCELYNIDEEEMLQSRHVDPDDGKDVPERLIHVLEEGKQVNVEHENKLKRVVMTSSIAAIILLTAAFVFAKIYIFNSSPAGNTVDPEPIAGKGTEESYKEVAKKLESLVPHEPFNMEKLNVPE